jgi:hypothetical protein
MKWKPIDNSPRTRTARLVYCPENMCTFLVYWLEDGWSGEEKGWHHFGGNDALLKHTPTHWMPLPKPPEAI